MKIVIDIPDGCLSVFKDWKARGIATGEQCIIADGIPLEEARQKGKWELYQYQGSRKKDWYCTACATIVKKPLEKKYIFCPYCGAQMQAEK